MNCNQRETNRAAVALSWIQTNNVYCTKRLQTLWGYIPHNLPLVFIYVFSIWLNTILFKHMLSAKMWKMYLWFLSLHFKNLSKGCFHLVSLIILDRRACSWQVCIFLDILHLILSAVFRFFKMEFCGVWAFVFHYVKHRASICCFPLGSLRKHTVI